jgi:hypothetical protein
MLSTGQVAIDILNNDLDVADLHEDARFLTDVDHTIVILTKTGVSWSGSHIARKRREIITKIEKLTKKERELDE